MKINFHRTYMCLLHGEKVPRKHKKMVLGTKSNGNEIRQHIKDFLTGKLEHPYKCTNCGCELTYGTGNKTEYPEHWEHFYCLRCDDLVSYIDNSPMIYTQYEDLLQ